MRTLLLATTIAIMPSASISTSTSKPPKSSSNPNFNCNSLLCRHSPSATLDILILILVLFSGTFLLTSYFSYIFNSLSILLSHSNFHFHRFPFLYLLGFFVFFAVFIGAVKVCFGARSRKCEEPGCKGLKKAMEFDLQFQTEECVKTGSKDIDKLPWKGVSEANPDYECLRSELRKMAPPNGRAVLLFRARCGCPVAKLVGWGTKRGKRHKKKWCIKKDKNNVGNLVVIAGLLLAWLIGMGLEKISSIVAWILARILVHFLLFLFPQ